MRFNIFRNPYIDAQVNMILGSSKDMQLKICFAVHSYYPNAGGSEYYVQQMAEECVSRGMDVTVATADGSGILNGVKITSDPSSLMDQDLVVVHGGGPDVQRFVLENAKRINSPILYMIIEPHESKACLQAMVDVDYLGCSTIEDWDHVKKWGVEDKAHKVIHGISPKDNLGHKGIFKKKYGISDDTRMFLSCGGYWGNKRMLELAEAFKKSDIQNSILVTTGYANPMNLMPKATDKVIPLMLDDPQDVKNAMADAHCYIMNSEMEGFGLTILESMLNKTPWIARNIAGARLLADFGTVYETEEQLIPILQTYIRDEKQIDSAYNYVLTNHLIGNTIDDIMSLSSARKRRSPND